MKRNALGVIFLEDATIEEIMEEMDKINRERLAKMRMEDLSNTITDVLEKLKNGMVNDNLGRTKSDTPGSLKFIRPTQFPAMRVQPIDDNIVNCFNWVIKKSTSKTRVIHKKLYDLEQKILNDYNLSEEDLEKAIPEIESILEKIQKSKEVVKATEEEMQRDRELTQAIAILYRVAHKDPLIKELINKDTSMEESHLKEFLDKTIHILEEPFRVTLLEDIRINRNLISKDLEILMHGIVTPFIRACFEYCNKFKGGKSYIISDIDMDHRLKPMVKKYIAEYKSEGDN